jgi:hypothetical protein
MKNFAIAYHAYFYRYHFLQKTNKIILWLGIGKKKYAGAKWFSRHRRNCRFYWRHYILKYLQKDTDIAKMEAKIFNVILELDFI